MGTLVGHVLPGFGFFIIGLWHLFNHIKLHALHPNSYTFQPWFPAPKFKYIEPFLIMIGCSISVSMELFIGPVRHQPFDPDGTIPSNHLHNFEHSSIAMTFFIFAAFAIVLDRIGLRQLTSKDHQNGLTQLIAAIGFGQQLLLLHFHSTDHKGFGGQYHLLLQILILVSLVTTLLGIGLPKSFLVSFVRSLSILFQGVWFIVMGIMIWTPAFLPKGCFLHFEDGHQVAHCSSDEAHYRAKSLVNILFSWLLIIITLFAVSFYLFLVKIYCEEVEYRPLTSKEEEEVSEDIESQKKSKLEEMRSFTHMGNAFGHVDMER